MENYNLMTTNELVNKMEELSKEYEEYKPILAEVLSNMDKLSETYNEIKNIIDIRNGRTQKQ